MMRHGFSVCGFLFLTCLISEGFAEQMGHTRRYEPGGVSLEAGFIPDATEIILGRPLFITFTVTNRSGADYGFFVGGDNRGSVRHNNFRITAVDASGKPVQDPYSYDHHGGWGQNVVLKPGENYSERLYLGHWCAFEGPGTYTVTCRRTLSDGHEEPGYEDLTVTSVFGLKIVPYDARRMGEIIDDLGFRVRDAGKQELCEVSLALASISDERIVPYLALSLTKGDHESKLPAIQGLAQFSTDEAADAFITALMDPDYVVRDAAGKALRDMGKQERALGTLVPRLGDGSPSDRALAARALGSLRDEASLGDLLEATRDPDPEVRAASTVALAAMGADKAERHLREFVGGDDMGMRVAAAEGLRTLGEPLDPEWLTPVIPSATHVNDRNFHEAIRLVRIYGGERAATALLSCLDFNDPSLRNSYNLFLILAIHHAPDGPDCYYRYHHDPNRDGTPEEVEENRQLLAELRRWMEDHQ